MAAARVNRLRSVTTRPKSGSVAFQQRGAQIARPKALSIGSKNKLTKKASSKGFNRVHYSDAPTTPKMLISVEEKTKQQKANLTAEEQALWVSGDIRCAGKGR